MEKSLIQRDDLQRLAAGGSAELAGLFVAYLDQSDPDPYEEVEGPADEEEGAGERPPKKEPPEGWISIHAHLSSLRDAQRQRTKAKRRVSAQEAWQKFLAQTEPPLPERFTLGDLVIELFERDDPAARQALLALIDQVPLKYGVWRGLKRIYKEAERRMDAEVYGALAARFDASLTWSGEVGRGTLIHLRRRAWRFLRQLGGAVPELYPRFAVEVLRRYEENASYGGLWVANHIMQHGTKKYDAHQFFSKSPPSDMVKHRAFPDAWKRAPEALMFLLETCRSDAAAQFAIQGLQKDFADRLRNASPTWLARLADRPLASAHEFLVETLLGSPEFHQGKLRELGLHEAVVALLRSPNQKARRYAVDYARGHAKDLPKEALFELLDSDDREVAGLAATLLTGRPARELGHVFLGRLLALDETHKWAKKSLEEAFERKELPLEFLASMLRGRDEQRDWAEDYIERKYPGNELGARFWMDLLDGKEDLRQGVIKLAFKVLGKLKSSALDAGWLMDALTRSELSEHAGKILRKSDHLAGLDVERLKGFVFNPSYREVALEALSNTKLVSPKALGLPWLLALAKRADPSLHEFAHRYLLEHLKPADFSDSGQLEAGVERLYQLALGDKEPEPIRVFAQTYLRCHHPKMGPEQPESKQFSLKPYLKAAHYDPERLWAALADGRDDVRKFGLLFARVELRAWGFQARVYDLCESDAKDVRNLGYDALQGAGDEEADPAVALRLDELDAARIFQLTESTKRSTREVGMGLIRRHYGRLGGAERLGWLMQSADREVRLFAVRLLWEKHRPRAYPPGWKPRKSGDIPLEDAGRFGDVEALRGLLRRLLFGLPPGRSAQPSEGRRGGHVSAGVIKRNIVDLVRDLGVEDPAFAALVAPVLQEFTGSLAVGEWQACLAALARLQSAHPELGLLRSLWLNTTSDISKRSARSPAGRGRSWWAACGRARAAR